MSTIERFEIGSSIRGLLAITFWIAGAGAALILSLPVLYGTDRLVGKGTVDPRVAVPVAVGLAGMAWYLRRTLKKVDSLAVSLDSEGIWLTHQPRAAGLIPWEQVSQVRERPLLQRLDLLDGSKNILLRLDYQLDRFPLLRERVLARSALQPVGLGNRSFEKSWLHHAGNLSVSAGFLATGFFIFESSPIPAILMLPLVWACLAEYLQTVYKIELQGANLVVRWPMRQQVLRRDEILAIELSDLIVQLARHPEVEILTSKSSQPLRLRGLGKSGTELLRTLKAWLAGAP